MIMWVYACVLVIYIEECALPIITVEKDFNIKEYFKHLVNIETILQFLTARYKKLTEEQLEARKYALKEKEFFKI